MTALTRERDDFASSAPSLPAKNRVTRIHAGRIAGALALAAALVLFLTFRGGGGDEGTRTKGGKTKLGFYVNHGGNVRLGGPDEHVVPGDGLRFVVTTGESAFLAVLSVDGAGHVSSYYPASLHEGTAAGAGPVAAGHDVALPLSTTLDETLGSETIYGVFCSEDFEIEPMRRALEATGGKNPPQVGPGCTVEVLAIHKEASSPP
jgi:hypothetical protein